MLNVKNLLDSLCLADRKIIENLLLEFIQELNILKLDTKIWKDRAINAEERMCSEYQDFRNKKKQIKNILKGMGVKIPPGSPISKLLRRY